MGQISGQGLCPHIIMNRMFQKVKTMKKEYIRPTVSVIEMDPAGMLCQSDAFGDMTDQVDENPEELPVNSDKKFNPWESL